MGRLTGKSAIVTGAASGIGRAAAHLFAAEGANVVAADWADCVDDVAAEIADAGGRAVAVRGDAGDDKAVAETVTRCLDAYGQVDTAFANAGVVGPTGSIFEQTSEDWLELLRINLVGGFLMLKHAGRAMAARGSGSIILTASVAGLRANGGPPAYSAAKAGMANLAKTGAYELIGSGVRVNAICPGLIETGMTEPMFERARERDQEDKLGRFSATSRPGQPEEIAQMAVFLASDDASFVNGQALPVDGGFSSTLPFMPTSNPGELWKRVMK